MTEFHCNCGATITGTKRDIAAHLAGCATVRAPAPRPPAPATGDNGRVSSCPHYGREVPHDFTGCARCLIAQECYDVYVKRAAQGAREAA